MGTEDVNEEISASSTPLPTSSTINNAAPDGENHFSSPGEGDLVIRDGFPALLVPINSAVGGDDHDSDSIKVKEKYQYMLTGDEPLPRHSFWTCEQAIDFHPDHLQTLRQDCETVFTARDKPDGAAYSAGQTFFLPATMKPRCALEAVALSIFQKHTQHLEPGMFNPAQSGANWWTLVMDEEGQDDSGEDGAGGQEKANAGSSKDTDDDNTEEGEDEVALHFDADYELEEQTTNILLHPRVATVTYLSDYGAPTLILDQKSPPMDDLERKTLEQGIGKAWLSHPNLGKHTAFDGRLLHGAPALYFPSLNNRSGDIKKEKITSAHDAVDEPASKRQRTMTESNGIHQQPKKRYTLLVNVWLNHWVMDAGLLDDEVCAKLKTPFQVEGSNLKGDEGFTSPFAWRSEIELGRPSKDMENIKKVELAPSLVDPAGEDEITLCNHNVTVKYNPTMAECHLASSLGPSVELELVKGAIVLHVGDMVPNNDQEE